HYQGGDDADDPLEDGSQLFADLRQRLGGRSARRRGFPLSGAAVLLVLRFPYPILLGIPVLVSPVVLIAVPFLTPLSPLVLAATLVGLRPLVLCLCLALAGPTILGACSAVLFVAGSSVPVFPISFLAVLALPAVLRLSCRTALVLARLAALLVPMRGLAFLGAQQLAPFHPAVLRNGPPQESAHEHQHRHHHPAPPPPHPPP